ncbi:MAG: hypothetical protein U0Q18_25430 [Bryobacteraceae bacterium]
MTLRQKNGYTVIGYRPLDLQGWGASQEDALAAFADQLIGLLNWFAREPENRLDIGARALKRTVFSLVASTTNDQEEVIAT